MDIETIIALGFLFIFVAGILIGWYVTYQKFHQEEVKRKTIKDYINHVKIKTPPKTEKEEFIDLIAKLNNSFVDEYRIVYGGDVFIFTSQAKQTEGEA